MKLIVRGSDTVALFGTGLIGSAILRGLRGKVSWEKDLPFSWTSLRLRSEQSADILKHLRNAGTTRLTVVWSAGAAGFAANEKALTEEAKAFEEVVAFALAACRHTGRAAFHHISSAGGLFEGQINVDHARLPSPKRPYGQAKLAQEQRLSALTNELDVTIYRPSSVYGFSRAGRSGLITTLITNGFNRRTTSIFGLPETLRDYVFLEDIGRFVAGRIMAGEAASEAPLFLVSGRPSSMHEVIASTRRVLKRPLYVQYDHRPSNAAHMSFSRSALPRNWRTTDIMTGIRLVTESVNTAALTSAAHRFPC